MESCVMWQFVNVYLQSIFLSFVLFSASVSATALTFTPQITINKDNTAGGGIVIKADNTDFTAHYSSSLNTFLPLKMPFTVRTENNAPQKYVIKLKESHHWCDSNGVQGDTLQGVRVMLDTVDALVPNAGLFVDDSTESTHEMIVSFPEIPVNGDQQTCYGTLVLIAEIPN